MFSYFLSYLTPEGESQYMAVAWDVTSKAQKDSTSWHPYPLWFKEYGRNFHFYFFFITPGFTQKVASVENCMQQCGGPDSKKNPTLLEDLERGASVGKIVLGNLGEERTGRGFF